MFDGRLGILNYTPGYLVVPAHRVTERHGERPFQVFTHAVAAVDEKHRTATVPGQTYDAVRHFAGGHVRAMAHARRKGVREPHAHHGG